MMVEISVEDMVDLAIPLDNYYDEHVIVQKFDAFFTKEKYKSILESAKTALIKKMFEKAGETIYEMEFYNESYHARFILNHMGKRLVLFLLHHQKYDILQDIVLSSAEKSEKEYPKLKDSIPAVDLMPVMDFSLVLEETHKKFNTSLLYILERNDSARMKGL